jgi:hypothetical protein
MRNPTDTALSKEVLGWVSDLGLLLIENMVDFFLVFFLLRDFINWIFLHLMALRVFYGSSHFLEA